MQVLNVQSSSGNIGLSGKFTVNLGVYLPAVAARLGNATDAPWPKEYQCTLRERIGSLMPTRDDFWWHLDSSTDLDRLAAQVLGVVNEVGIPWLEAAVDPSRQLSIAGACAYHLEVAAVALELGQPEVAKRRLEAALAERPVAAAHVQRFAQRNLIPLGRG